MYGYDIFHENIMENLINNIRNNSARHAYIFEGEKGVGTYAAARLFAAAMVCEKTENAPCGACPSCIMAAAETHPDIRIISPPDGKKNISFDMVRDIVTDAYTKPYESRRKVYIIAYGDDMNEQAQNAFLKVLEEPPEYAAFVILAENHETLLQTVRSRCIQIRFGAVAADKIKIWLQKRYPELGDRADFYAKYAGGVAGRAERIINDENFIPLRKAAFEKSELLLSPSKLDAYAAAEFLEENKDNADLILELWQSFVRDMMLLQNGAKDCAMNSDFIDRLIAMSNRYTEKRIVRAADEIMTAQKMRRRYVSLHTLALRMAFTIKRKG